MYHRTLDILQTFELHLEAHTKSVHDLEHMAFDVHHFPTDDVEFSLRKDDK